MSRPSEAAPERVDTSKRSHSVRTRQTQRPGWYLLPWSGAQIIALLQQGSASVLLRGCLILIILHCSIEKKAMVAAGYRIQ